MKTYAHGVLKAAFFMATVELHSQTLTCQDNCPQPGQLFSIKTSSPVVATPGFNKVWNFTQVQAVSSGVVMVSYVTPSATPSGSMFTQATVAKLQSGGYAFLETGSGGVKLSIAANVTVNAQSLVLPLPFSYGSKHSETITTISYNGATKIETRRTKSLDAVGTGTLILPTGTYTDVLLISGQTVESYTTAGVPNANIVTYNFSTFYSEKIPQPLLYSEYKWETGPADYGPYTEFIAGMYTGVSSESKEGRFGIELSPNPCSDFVNVTSSVNEPCELFLINSLGETVQNLHSSGGPIVLDLRDLPVGLYTLLVSQREGNQYKRLIVSR